MINIAKLLKNAPKGLELYSPICGNCKLSCILYDDGIRVIAHDVPFRFDKYGRFCSADDSECLLFPSKDRRTWEGWKLPVEPKFKVGDWVVIDNRHNSTYQVECVREYDYMLKHTHGGLMPFPFSSIERLRPWTIEDAKDGDVLVCYTEVKGSHIEQAGIFKRYVGRHGGCSNTFLAHTGIDWDGNIIINGYMGSTNIFPATKEQRDLLFAKMKEAGYQWDADKKELHKIQSHYDIKNFKPFDKVLVRDTENEKWVASLFSNFEYGAFPHKFVCIDTCYTQCIPFEGNEHLLGTTDMPSEEFINW